MRSIRALWSRRELRPVLVAGVTLLLLAGTAWAASPSAPAASPSASAGADQSASPAGSASPAASESPEVSESPEASPSPAASTSPGASASPSAAASPKAAASPEADDETETPDGSPSPAQITRAVGRLSSVGIKTTEAELQALASKVGLGGAIRVLAFADASGKTPDQIVAMFQAGSGWGAIRHQLNLSIGPGIGWIMGAGHSGKSH